MSQPPTDSLLEQVRDFVSQPVLLTSFDEIQTEMAVPETWVKMLRRQSAGTRSWIEPWEPYRHLLPGVYDFLQHKVRGVCVLCEDQKPPSLLYVYSTKGEDDFHRGWPPLSGNVPEGKQAIWTQLFPGLKKFYSDLHNDWVCLPANSLGPLPVENIERLSDQDWDLEPDDERKLPFRLDEVLTVFSNGGGDYLGLDVGKGVSASEDHALAWWHEEPLTPDIDLNFWALMDGWICGQMEDVDRAE